MNSINKITKSIEKYNNKKTYKITINDGEQAPSLYYQKTGN